MSRRTSSTTLLAGAAVATAAAFALAGCSSATATASPRVASVADAHSRGAVHLTAYTNNDGPTDTVIVTGAVGDYGTAVSVYPNGTVDPDHNSELKLQLAHGTFRLDAAALDKAFVAAMLQDFPSNTTTCSGNVDVTGQVPVVAGSGSGAYKGIGGSFTLTISLDEVDKVATGQPCNGSAAFLSQAIVISGPGTVTF